MAVIKRENGHFQARIVGIDGRIICATFPTKKEAQAQELQWKQEKQKGLLGTSAHRQMTVSDFFEEWHRDVSSEMSEKNQSGWRNQQLQYFRDYIKPVLGAYQLHAVTPQMVKRVLNEMAKADKSPTTQRLVYATMRKLFNDAVEIYQYSNTNPVLKKLKPVAIYSEARHLNIQQIASLLQHVENRKYGLAIWTQLYLGLRVGELIALRWEDIDLLTGRVVIRRTFVKKLNLFREYPKGKRQHAHSIPTELLTKLRKARKESPSEFVVTSRYGGHLPYRWYLVALKKYCGALKIPVIGTHGLRHSTSELYIEHGATRDDLRRLFAHSTPSVTDRYVHNRGTNLERVANVIRLFPDGTDPDSSRYRHPSETADCK